tara:strand:- start:12 stop:161 length:150 start_codon:yes stop_codon:yes gene_type:complete
LIFPEYLSLIPTTREPVLAPLLDLYFDSALDLAAVKGKESEIFPNGLVY